MKLIGTFLLVLCFAFAGLSVAAEKGAVSSQGAKQGTSEAQQKAASPTAQEKENYINLIQSKLADVSKMIDHLKEQAKTAQGEAYTKAQSAIATLKTQQGVAQKKLHELRSSSGAAWAEMKAGMSKAVDNLQKAYAEAAKQFK
ncbi:MAG: hypothetical protein WBG50_10830 [Desulfomonilaceae bacterium]